MRIETTGMVGAAFMYDDDGIHEQQTRRLEIDNDDIEHLSCRLCGSPLYIDIGIPLHVGLDGHLYCNAMCEREMEQTMAIADAADALIERGAFVPERDLVLATLEAS